MSKSNKISLLIFLVSAGIVLLLKLFVLDIYTYAGKHVWIRKTSDIPSGKLILYDINDTLYVSRLVALSGDKVKFENGILFVNDKISNKHTKYSYRYLQNSADTAENILQLELTDNEAKNSRFTSFILKKNIYPSYAKAEFAFSKLSEYTNSDNFEIAKIPDNQIFVLNDSHADKNDSRAFGLINKSQIVGYLLNH